MKKEKEGREEYSGSNIPSLYLPCFCICICMSMYVFRKQDGLVFFILCLVLVLSHSWDNRTVAVSKALSASSLCILCHTHLPSLSLSPANLIIHHPLTPSLYVSFCFLRTGTWTRMQLHAYLVSLAYVAWWQHGQMSIPSLPLSPPRWTRLVYHSAHTPPSLPAFWQHVDVII